jgi:integrating conjugative element protein (TIGR03752 family)
MKSNALLKWLMLPVVVLLLYIGLKVFKRDSSTAPSAHHDNASTLTPDEMKALGVEGDTPRDTVATLVAQVKQLRGELQTAVTDNKAQQAENERLRTREGAIDQRIQTALEGERVKLQQDRDQVVGEKQQTQGLLADIQRKLDNLSGKDAQPDLPVGLGLDDPAAQTRDGTSGTGNTASNTFNSSTAKATASIRWIEPDDVPPDAKGSATGASKPFSFPTSFRTTADSAQSTLEKTWDTATTKAAEAGNQALNAVPTPSSKPVYTVPANTTLTGSVAMTALIGRVPVDGTVNDPYPFKVLIGADNLTANGIEIPDVAGAVVSGTASGDWTLSCVRGQIRSITFVFQDGTVRTLPESGKDGAANGAGSNGDSQGRGNATQGGLGWISDPYGIPCVSGIRRSNAQQYLGTQALVTAAGAGAASLIKSDNGGVTVMSGGSNGSIGTVGISGNEAMGRILAGGVQDMSQWINKLYGQAFAAIYVKPGAAVAVHLEQPLNIDYEAKGRKVNHRTGGAHATDMD